MSHGSQVATKSIIQELPKHFSWKYVHVHSSIMTNGMLWCERLYNKSLQYQKPGQVLHHDAAAGGCGKQNLPYMKSDTARTNYESVVTIF